jgi:hypothetical protein
MRAYDLPIIGGISVSDDSVKAIMVEGIEELAAKLELDAFAVRSRLGFSGSNFLI